MQTKGRLSSCTECGDYFPDEQLWRSSHDLPQCSDCVSYSPVADPIPNTRPVTPPIVLREAPVPEVTFLGYGWRNYPDPKEDDVEMTAYYPSPASSEFPPLSPPTSDYVLPPLPDVYEMRLRNIEFSKALDIMEKKSDAQDEDYFPY